MDQKGFAPLFILLGALVVVGMIGGIYYLITSRNPNTPAQNPKVTSEASTSSQKPMSTSSGHSSLNTESKCRNYQEIVAEADSNLSSEKKLDSSRSIYF